MYDLIREILGPYIQGCLLFGGLSRGQQLPDRLTALLTLKHPDIALFATPRVMKAFQAVRRTDEHRERHGKIHPEIGEGLVKIREKVGHRLGLALLPDRTKHLGLGTSLPLSIARVNRTGLGSEGLFAHALRFALRFVIAFLRIHLEIPVDQMVGTLLDRVKDATLVRHPRAMVSERLLKPLSAIADHCSGVSPRSSLAPRVVQRKASRLAHARPESAASGPFPHGCQATPQGR